MLLKPINTNIYNIIDDFFNTNVSQSFKIDVKDLESEYVVEAELPGIKKEEIKLEYNDGKLLISVKHEEQINDEKENYIHKERRMSSMQRGIYLKDVDEENIKAKLENGILTIKVPKIEKVRNEIQIEVL